MDSEQIDSFFLPGGILELSSDSDDNDQDHDNSPLTTNPFAASTTAKVNTNTNYRPPPGFTTGGTSTSGSTGVSVATNNPILGIPLNKNRTTSRLLGAYGDLSSVAQGSGSGSVGLHRHAAIGSERLGGYGSTFQQHQHQHSHYEYDGGNGGGSGIEELVGDSLGLGGGGGPPTHLHSALLNSPQKSNSISSGHISSSTETANLISTNQGSAATSALPAGPPPGFFPSQMYSQQPSQSQTQTSSILSQHQLDANLFHSSEYVPTSTNVSVPSSPLSSTASIANSMASTSNASLDHAAAGGSVGGYMTTLKPPLSPQPVPQQQQHQSSVREKKVHHVKLAQSSPSTNRITAPSSPTRSPKLQQQTQAFSPTITNEKGHKKNKRGGNKGRNKKKDHQQPDDCSTPPRGSALAKQEGNEHVSRRRQRLQNDTHRPIPKVSTRPQQQNLQQPSDHDAKGVIDTTFPTKPVPKRSGKDRQQHKKSALTSNAPASTKKKQPVEQRPKKSIQPLTYPKTMPDDVSSTASKDEAPSVVNRQRTMSAISAASTGSMGSLESFESTTNPAAVKSVPKSPINSAKRPPSRISSGAPLQQQQQQQQPSSVALPIPPTPKPHHTKPKHQKNKKSNRKQKQSTLKSHNKSSAPSTATLATKPSPRIQSKPSVFSHFKSLLGSLSTKLFHIPISSILSSFSIYILSFLMISVQLLFYLILDLCLCVCYTIVYLHKIALKEVMENKLAMFGIVLFSNYTKITDIAMQRYFVGIIPHWLPSLCYMILIQLLYKCNTIRETKDTKQEEDTTESKSTDERNREAAHIFMRVLAGGKDGKKAKKEAVKLWQEDAETHTPKKEIIEEPQSSTKKCLYFLGIIVFVLESMTSAHAHTLFSLSKSEQIVMNYTIVAWMMGYVKSPIIWISWSMQLFLLGYFPTYPRIRGGSFVFEHVLLIWSLASLYFTRKWMERCGDGGGFCFVNVTSGKGGMGMNVGIGKGARMHGV